MELLQLDDDIVEKIMSLEHGTQRTNELTCVLVFDFRNR